MTKEEAIRIIKIVLAVAEDFEITVRGEEFTEEKCKEAVDMAIEALEQTRWIPVSERLPEDHKDVLICLSSDQICIGCYNSHKLPFSNNAIGWGASYTHNWCSNNVIAWMPLPEPYKASPTGAERSEE